MADTAELACSQAHHGSEHNTDSADSEGTCESAHRMPPGLQLDGLISHINHTRSLYSRKSPPSSTSGDNICLVGEASGRIRWIQPSGAVLCPLCRPSTCAQAQACVAAAGPGKQCCQAMLPGRALLLAQQMSDQRFQCSCQVACSLAGLRHGLAQLCFRLPECAVPMQALVVQERAQTRASRALCLLT